MITSFGNTLARDLFEDQITKAVRYFPRELWQGARRKLLVLYDAAKLNDLRVLPGNRLEKLKGNRKDFWSIRINKQWRIVFKWDNECASEVSVEDCH